MTEIIKTDNAPKGIGPYVQGRIAGNFIYTSGQIPLDPKTNEVVGETIEEQARQTLNNVKAVIKAGGGTLRDIIKVNVFLTDLNDFAKFNEVYKEFFPEDFPCRTTVGVNIPKVKIEIDAIAYISD